MPQMTENLHFTHPDKHSEFATNYFFRLMLQICKRCIELDISCFRTIEIIFGFIQNNQNRPRFYDSCGLPRYVLDTPFWTPARYGNAELKRIRQSVQEKWEIETLNDYPSIASNFCGSEDSARRESWFVVQNIDYFGRIGGFDAIIQRIGHALCPFAISDVVNLIRPVAQV